MRRGSFVQPGDDEFADEPSLAARTAGREALTPEQIRGRDTQAPAEGAAPVHFSPEMGRKLRVFAVALALVLLLGFGLVYFLKSREQSALAAESRESAGRLAEVTVAPVQADAGDRVLTLPGETAAWYESIIYGRVSGYVAKWHADIGDHVRQGQTLALIDTPELDAQLAAARAQRNAADAEVRVRQAEVELATTTYERWRDAPKGVVSEQEREQKKADFDSAAARLNAARAQVAVSQADVDRYAALTEFKRVAAPFDGTIVERRIDIGNLVTAGSTAATTSLYRMSQDRPIRVFVDVPQRASGELMKPGVPVQVRASNLPGRVFTGSLARSARSINPQARTLKVEVDLPNADQALVPGMYVDVVFQLGTGGLLQVPAAALVFRTSGPQVAVVDKDNRIRFRAVTIARDDGSVVELGSGVAPGDRVALNISSQIAEGDAVAASELKPAAPAVASSRVH
jgi:RND family efflux transporter MFP subunit